LRQEGRQTRTERLRAERADDEQGDVRARLSDRAQQREARLVGPVEIVEDERERRHSRRRAEDGDNRLAQPLGAPCLCRAERCGEQLQRPRIVAQEIAEQRDPGQIGRRIVAIEGAPARDAHPLARGVRARPLGQRGLADTGFPAEQQHAAPPGTGLGKGVAQRRLLAHATDEGSRHTRLCHRRP